MSWMTRFRARICSPRRLRLALILFLFMTGLFAIHPGMVAIQCARIRRWGGVVETGSPPVYGQLAYTTRTPAWVRSVLLSRIGRWYFGRMSVGGIDLLAVGSADDVAAALRAARVFEDLTSLTLYRSGVTDDHLEELATSFPKLRSLKINETAITDRGVRHLRGLRSLEVLNVQKTAITDASPPHLASLPRLKELSIGQTAITSLQPLRDALPNCRIHSNFVHASRCPSCRQLLNECRCRRRMSPRNP